MPRRFARIVFAMVLAVAMDTGCRRRAAAPPTSEAAQRATAMGSWEAWLDLSPLIDVAKNHAPEPTVAGLEEAAKLLREGKARSADRKLSVLADGEGRHWIAVARADLAAIYFTRCIRGLVWRLEDLGPKSSPTRQSDFSETTKIEPGDISVEAMLTNLDAALSTADAALKVQARIARARVTAYSARCAANDDVQQMSEGILRADLATLAAEHHLTPDLAYLWAGVQLADYSGAAAKPFLLMARDGGYADPSVVYMLGMIALEQRELDLADKHAVEAFNVYVSIKDRDQQAQALVLRGEIARTRPDVATARKHYEAARKLVPGHPGALLGVARMIAATDGANRAVTYLQQAMPQIVLTGPLDADKLETAASNLEALAVLASEPDLATICRDAMLAEVDLEADPMRRGLRYFFAATLDARLGEYTHARAHAVLARDEFTASEQPPPLDVEAFIQRIDAITG